MEHPVDIAGARIASLGQLGIGVCLLGGGMEYDKHLVMLAFKGLRWKAARICSTSTR